MRWLARLFSCKSDDFTLEVIAECQKRPDKGHIQTKTIRLPRLT